MIFRSALKVQSWRKVLLNEAFRTHSCITSSSSNIGGSGTLGFRSLISRQIKVAYSYSTSSLASKNQSQAVSHFHLPATNTAKALQFGHRRRWYGIWARLRSFSSSGSSEVVKPTEGEMKLKATIKKYFPNATDVTVEDISGGCGSMYQIYIEAPEFTGLTTVKQHRLVNEALKEDIKSMHGIRIQTAVPKKS